MEVEGEGAMLTRIFVGGLGGSVTAEDLEKTFSSLGSIRGVEIVRTNGRSFAYMDFQPSSSKALSKLFSTYNGCIWKGGRLRLEKAKEHYLVRLRREWEEDAELASNALKVKDDPVAEENIDHSEKLKSLTEEKMQLRIFFPGLRKIKSLPYRGSGKHKYSFQRIEVPSLPIHFCDCEEHCGPIEIAKREHVNALETETGAADEEELNMMRSVMEKILKRENNSETGSNGAKIATEGDDFNKPNDDIQLDENEAAGLETGGDDLVINMVNGENGRLRLMESEGQGTITTDRDSKFSKRRFSDDAIATNNFKAQKRKNTELFYSSDPTSNKKAHLHLGEENNQDEFTPTKPKNKGCSENLSVESKGVAKHQPPEQKASIQQSSGGLSWLQKSSWKKMVGETAGNSFSISHILPETAPKKSSPKSNDLATANLTGSKKQKKVKFAINKSTGDGSKDLGLGKEVRPQDEVTRETCSTMVPSKTTSHDSEGPKEAKPTDQETNIHQSTSKSTEDGLKDLEHGKEGSPQEKVTAASCSTIMPSKNTSEESEDPKESKPTEQKMNTHQPTGGHSWIQKSAWRDLVGETNNSSFSISHILPGINSITKKVQETNNSDTANSSGSTQKNLAKSLRNEVTADSAKSKDGNQNDNVNPKKEDGILVGLKGEFNLLGKNSENDKEDTNAHSNPSSKSKSSGEPNKKAKGNVVSVEVSTFMRTAASEKEWLKIKTALSGSLKKKSTEKQH
ncbi:RNA recognition motif domain [Macleaya cordata]|uniref:RNA recognition motif domain n=1 Tax=Macleaya cordata TaxID=56857 RepID=A0A200QB58_MACCD|nr:RNA recognition motif domain [Macleaya cordata]